MLAEVDVPDHPLGSVHMYDVAPLTPAEKNVSRLPLHTVVGPVIYAGVAGTVDIDTPNVCAVELPQLLFAVTDIVPPVALAVALMLLVVDVPDHPLGSVHVYVVAPLTAATE